MSSGLSAVAAWSMSAVLASAGIGFAWAGQTVEIPIVWLLILTFVPTRELTESVRMVLDEAVKRVGSSQSKNE